MGTNGANGEQRTVAIEHAHRLKRQSYPSHLDSQASRDFNGMWEQQSDMLETGPPLVFSLLSLPSFLSVALVSLTGRGRVRGRSTHENMHASRTAFPASYFLEVQRTPCTLARAQRSLCGVIESDGLFGPVKVQVSEEKIQAVKIILFRISFADTLITYFIHFV